MRYVISLTSIPPRLSRLPPVLAALAAQRPAPDRILLSLPRRFLRFPDAALPPPLWEGVDLLWCDEDLGPATKVLPAASMLAGSGIALICCDDDWLYQPGWAAALLDASDEVATTGQAWDVRRIGRQGTGCDIAQGFSGLCVQPDWLAGADTVPPDAARFADDVWLSAVLAHRNILLQERPVARNAARPAYDDTHGLQHSRVDGCARDAANRTAAACAYDRFGVWPAL